MTYVRILLHVIAGILLTNGWINEEIRDQIVNDPQIALGVQVALAAVFHVASLIWWRLAKRFGWKT